MVKKTVRTRLWLISVLVAALAAWSGAAAIAAAADATLWTWKPTGGVIKKPPIWHTATLLQDGKSVLVAGGCYHHDFSNDFLNITEKFVQKDWAPGPNLSYFRAGHTATLLNDGQVLVAGGLGGGLVGGLVIGTLDTCELLNKEGTAWGTALNLRSPRVFHTATLLDDGRVLVVGGGKFNWVGFSPVFPYFIIDLAFIVDTDCYTPGPPEQWENTGHLTQHRFLHTATRLDDGRRVLVVGGSDTKIVQGPTQPVVVPVPLTSCELFDSTTNSWQTVRPLNHSRIAHTATLLADGRVLAAGGETENANGLEPARSYEIYDPQKPEDGWICPTDKFPQDPSKRLQIPRALHTATLLTDGPEAGKVLIAGGDGLEADSSSELYDPANDTWGLYDDLNYPRSQHQAVRLSDGKVLAVGGTPNLAEIFLPVTAQQLLLRGKSRPLRRPRPGN